MNAEITPQAPRARPAATATAEQVEASGATVLVCDDERSNRVLACAALAGWDYSLVEAADGNEALELAHEVHPDIMIVNMMMPGRNGLDVVAELRTDPDFADMPAVMLTSRGGVSNRDDAADAGVDRYMTKPFNPLKLASVVDGLLRRRLTAQNVRLRELDAVKDRFIALLSHELRTPLTSIGGYLELMLEEESGPLNAQQRGFLEVIDRNAERLLQLIGDLLLIAQIESGELGIDRDVVNLAELAEICIETARPQAEEKRVQLHLHRDDEPVFRGDPARLSQAIDNLISNAVKFTPPGGRVEVRVYCAQQRAVVEVDDTGIGICEGEVDRLFTPFFRASNAVKREIQGSGLGLVITKAIVDAHRGDVGVESVEGVGTTLRLTFPLVDGPADDDTTTAA